MSDLMAMASNHLNSICVILAICTCRLFGMSPINDRLIVQTDSSSDLEHLYSYCNNPGSVHGCEGLLDQWYSLQQVHIVLTPGFTDVSSKVKVQNQTFPTMSCDISRHNSTLMNKFRKGTDTYGLVNHNRHFSHFHPTFPTYCSNNHLTSHGFQQMIFIGKHLKTSYLDHRTHKRLNGRYSSIYVRSTPSQTSYHSLLAFFHGFLNEKQLYKTKVHESRGDFCEFNELNLTTCNCAKIRELSPFAFRSSAKGTFLFKDSCPDKDKIVKLMQLDNVTKATGTELFQLLMQYKCHENTNLSSKTPKLCHLMDEKRLTVLHRALAQTHLTLYTDSNFRTHAELRVYPFLEQLMMQAKRLDSQRAVNVYMGDKHFMQYLLSTLDIFQQQVMPIASRLVFEVFRKNEGQLDAGDLYLRVLYNGEDVTHKASVCSRGMENGLCKIDWFNLLVTSLREQYTENCSDS